MTFRNLIKQPWFQVLAGGIILISIILGFYYYAKSQGRKEEKEARAKVVTESLKTAQDALVKAETAKKEAEALEELNGKLKEISLDSKVKHEQREAQLSAVNQQEREEIQNEYQKNKDTINRDMSDCDRCRDICSRSNALAAAYGPDFAEFACDANTQCSLACE